MPNSTINAFHYLLRQQVLVLSDSSGFQRHSCVVLGSFTLVDSRLRLVRSRSALMIVAEMTLSDHFDRCQVPRP